jgi:hypothetical protein
MTKEKMYDPDKIGSFYMQFGMKQPTKYMGKSKRPYPDRRTKKFNAQRPHDGVIGAYKSHL